MRRRRLLGGLAAGASLLAGCIGSTDDPGGGDGTGGTPTATADGTGPTASPDPEVRTLSVEEVVNVTSTATHALRLNDLGESPRGRLPALSELSDRRREVVEAAIDGVYRTDDVPDWLADFVGGTRFVRADGGHYRLSDTLPTYAVTAEAAEASSVSGRIADGEAYREAVTHDGVVMTGLVRIARREGIEFTHLWPSLREFVDEYDAVRYRGDVVRLSLSVDDPGPPYAVTAERVPPTALAEDPVWDATDAPADVRGILANATDADGVYRVDDPPAPLLEPLRANRFLYFEGRFYTTYVEDRGPVPVSMDATFADPTLDDDPARLRIALHNERDGPVSVFSGAPPPFGVLRYHPEGAPDDRRLLWSDAYAESTHVLTSGHTVDGVEDIGLSTEVAAGESVSQSFVVEDRSLAPGRYSVEGSVGVSVPGTNDGGGDGGSFDYRVVLAVE